MIGSQSQKIEATADRDEISVKLEALAGKHQEFVLAKDKLEAELRAAKEV